MAPSVLWIAGKCQTGWRPRDGPGPAAAAPTGAVPAPSSPALDPNEARALEALAERDPNDVAVRVELGNLYMDHEQWENAIRWYRQALALEPGLTNILNELGACLVYADRPAPHGGAAQAVIDSLEALS